MAQEPRRRGRLWWCLALLPLVAPVLCVAMILLHFRQQCDPWRTPEPWVGAAPTVTVERISASMGSMSTTQRYRVSAPIAEVERYYLLQMRIYCQESELSPFATVYDSLGRRYQREASCRIRGVTAPVPTLDEWDNDMESRARYYESVKGTSQLFRVSIVSLGPAEQEVIHFDTISSICSY